MQLQLNIELNNDNELIHMANGTADGPIVINRFVLWVPKRTLYDKFVSLFLKESQWTCMREMYEVSAPTRTSGFFRTSASIDNVRYIFILRIITEMYII